MPLVDSYECEKCSAYVEFETDTQQYLVEEKLCRACYHDKLVQFRANQDIYWEDWGRMRRVFKKGHIYDGTQHEDGTVTAETPYYFGVSDYVDKDCIEILQRKECV